MMFENLKKALILVFIAVWIVAGCILIIYYPTSGVSSSSSFASFTRAEFISIVLTAVTAILAALAIMLAIAAVWGYSNLKDAAKDAADKIASEIASKRAEEVATSVARGLLNISSADAGNEGDAFAQAAREE